jgi:hypothetical protein
MPQFRSYIICIKRQEQPEPDSSKAALHQPRLWREATPRSTDRHISVAKTSKHDSKSSFSSLRIALGLQVCAESC